MPRFLTQTIFLYGTLKQGFSHNYLLRHQKFLSSATTTKRYQLYDAGGFPAMVEVSQKPVAVYGEVWQVTKECLAHLDRYECLHKGLYTRGPVFMDAPFEHDRVEGYLYMLPVTGLALVGREWHPT